MRRFRKPVGPQGSREFESPPLRLELRYSLEKPLLARGLLFCSQVSQSLPTSPRASRFPPSNPPRQHLGFPSTRLRRSFPFLEAAAELAASRLPMTPASSRRANSAPSSLQTSNA